MVQKSGGQTGKSSKSDGPNRKTPHQSTAQRVVNDRVGRLTRELEIAQTQLRTMREETEAAREELRAANEELRKLLSDLSHRMKNTLTVVMAIAHQTLRATPSPKDFAERFDGRLTALARAHDLLIQSRWNGADLETLARQQLGQSKERLKMQGATVTLPSELVTPFALALHELATNAAKHGSLSVSEGEVALKWEVSTKKGHRELEVEWREKSGPAVKPPAKSGLGTQLIDNGIPGATVTRDFLAEGLLCTIQVVVADANSRQDPA